jgi:hypothetical protein
VAGDLAGSALLRGLGGSGNALAIAFFIVSAAGLVLSARTRSR